MYVSNDKCRITIIVDLQCRNAKWFHFTHNKTAYQSLSQERDSPALIVHIIVSEVSLYLFQISPRHHVQMVHLVIATKGCKKKVAQLVEVFPVHDEATERYEYPTFQ